MRRRLSVLVSGVAVALAGSALLADAALAAGRGGAVARVSGPASGASVAGRHGAGWQGGVNGHHRFAGRHDGRWSGAGWSYGGWGYGIASGTWGNSYVEELAVSRYDPWRDPAICCGPRLPIAIGIQAAPVLPPTTYVIEAAGSSRHSSTRRFRVGTRPLAAVSRQASAGVADPAQPRIIYLR